MTIELETSLSEFDAEASKAFAGRFVGILNDAATALLTSVGHQPGLFELFQDIRVGGGRRAGRSASPLTADH